MRRLLGPALVVAVGVVAQAQAPPRPARARAEGELAAIARLVDAGQLDQAEARLQKALAVRDDAGARVLLGGVLAQKGNLDEAEKQFRRALKLDPARLSARQGLVRVLAGQKRDAEAL
jgi:Tfp pilus assembly protein PilF